MDLTRLDSCDESSDDLETALEIIKGFYLRELVNQRQGNSLGKEKRQEIQNIVFRALQQLIELQIFPLERTYELAQ